jgi:hypothetical protein
MIGNGLPAAVLFLGQIFKHLWKEIMKSSFSRQRIRIHLSSRKKTPDNNAARIKHMVRRYPGRSSCWPSVLFDAQSFVIVCGRRGSVAVQSIVIVEQNCKKLIPTKEQLATCAFHMFI